MPTRDPNHSNPNLNFLGTYGMAQARGMFYAHRNDQRFKISANALHHQRAMLPTALAYYTQQLSETNEDSFRFLNRAQKIALMNRLVYTLYLLNMQYQLDDMEGRRYNMKDLRGKINACNERLDRLGVSPDEDSPGSLLLDDTIASQKPLKYTATGDFSSTFASIVLSFFDSVKKANKHRTGTFIEAMSDTNIWRLYWVWGGSMMAALLTVLPDGMFNTGEASKRLNAPSPTTSYMSWILYYARFSINLGLLLKHTINGPWMSKKEAKIPVGERFQTQWQQRKFALLNDSIWATANLACCFWLTGLGWMGYGGNVATGVLLIMDLCLTIWRYWEESTAHNKKMLEIAQTYEALKTQIRELRAAPMPDEEQIAALEQQCQDLKKLHEDTEFDWQYRKWNTQNELIYCGGLLIAFALMCCFFFPPASIPAATVAAIGLAGAALCFLLTIINAAISGALDISKSHALGKKANTEGQSLLDQFHAATNDNDRKRLYLQLQAALAKSAYHQKMVRHQALNLVRSLLIDAMIPGLVFAAIALMPLGVGLAVLGAALVVFLASKIIMKQLEPDMGDLPEMDELSFAEFNANPPLVFPVNHSEHVRFFNPRPVLEPEEPTLTTPLLEQSPEQDLDDSPGEQLEFS